MEFLETHNLTGLVIGISTFLIIGIFHPIVIKTEYYLGKKYWWIFLITGILGAVTSVLSHNVILSSLSGVFAFSSFWCILEVFEQARRVEKGWFPSNPKKNKR